MPNFEFSQLRCFVAVGETLHFGRAAQSLNMTQPPLSRQIQLLEHAIGTRLFERTSRSVRLTAAGRSFLPEAQRLLRLAEAAAIDARRVAAGQAGSLKLGFTGGASYTVLPRLVSLATKSMPDIELVLREMRTAEQMEALAAGRLDAGLIRLPIDRTGIDLLCVSRDPLVLAAPDAHPLARRRTPPSLADLEAIPLVMYGLTENKFFHDLVASLFRIAGIEPRPVQHVNQIHTMLALVSAGIGVAIVPESAGFLAVHGVTLRRLEPPPPILAELYLVWGKSPDNPALATLIEHVLPSFTHEVRRSMKID